MVSTAYLVEFQFIIIPGFIFGNSILSWLVGTCRAKVGAKVEDKSKPLLSDSPVVQLLIDLFFFEIFVTNHNACEYDICGSTGDCAPNE